MTNRKLRKILNKNLEENFHLIEEADKAKEGLTFTHNNDISFNKNHFALLTCICLVFTIICSSLTSILIYRSARNNDDFIEYQQRNEAIEEANKELSLLCDRYEHFPLLTRQISNNYYINLYLGRTTDNDTLYFYQFCSLEENLNYVTLAFVSYGQKEVINEVVVNKVKTLNLSNKLPLSSLELYVFENEIEISHVTLI